MPKRGVPLGEKLLGVSALALLGCELSKSVTETQISALIRIKSVKSNEKLGMYGLAVAKNISYMSDRPCKKTWHHKSSNEGNLRTVVV